MIQQLLRSRARRFAFALLAAPLAVVPMLATPAQAQWVVFDPSNYAQNVLTAARSLQQITNQITSLQNETQMLINQARNLASLPISSLNQIEQSLQRTQTLLAQAQNITYNTQAINTAFQNQYSAASMSGTSAQLVANAQARWQNTLSGLQDAMKTQATVVSNLGTNSAQMSVLVNASQNATGALQATQAGNQLVALAAQQIADLTAVVAANGRADALRDAERSAAAAQGAAQRQMFLTPGAGYQPGSAQMFHSGI